MSALLTKNLWRALALLCFTFHLRTSICGLRLARHGAKLAYQRKLLVRYRYLENSLSGNDINRTNRDLRVYDKIESSLDLGQDPKNVQQQ